MSKSKLHTRDIIRDKALEMFNERGIEYVGLRELAAVLGIRVGNITYYFPTKDDLVYAVSLELTRANAAVMVVRDNATLCQFLEMMHQVFRNHYQFRCLLRSFVHLMQQNKPMAAAYNQTQTSRRDTIQTTIEGLALSGYLHPLEDDKKDVVVSAISLISRFWISEAAISFRDMSGEEQIRHYLALLAKLLLPYATAKGKTDINSFLASL